MGQIEIPLLEKTDRDGNEYYVGSLDMPVLVDMGKVSLFVFHGTEDGEECPKVVFRTKRPPRRGPPPHRE